MSDAGRDRTRATSAARLPGLARRRRRARAPVRARLQPRRRAPVRRIAAYDPGDTLMLDEVAQAHLELVRAADGGRAHSLLASSTRRARRRARGSFAAGCSRRSPTSPRSGGGSTRSRSSCNTAGARGAARARSAKSAISSASPCAPCSGRAPPKDSGRAARRPARGSFGHRGARSIPDPGARQAVGIAREGDVGRHRRAARSDLLENLRRVCRARSSIARRRSRATAASSARASTRSSTSASV